MSDDYLYPEVNAIEHLAEQIKSGKPLSDTQRNVIRDALDKLTEALEGSK
jgi:hypothetical protein